MGGGMDRLRASDYILVYMETTGFAPQRGDRIVELAALRCRPGDRFVTLVNPGRAVAGGHVHGIADADMQAAPRSPRSARWCVVSSTTA